MNRYFPLGACAVLLVSRIASAAPVHFDCPKSLAVDQIVNNAPEGWELLQDAGLAPPALATIAVYTGHPSRLGSLVPVSRRAGSKETNTWLLPDDPELYWMACVYDNSRLLLAKPIPVAARKCIQTDRLLPNGKRNGIVSFVCE